MNIEQAHFNMVEQQIRPWEVLDQEVLDLLLAMKRGDFVPAAYRNFAYADSEIPLGTDSAMLNPKFEAHALQALKVKRGETVLEIGTGSGYLTALLAADAASVRTYEIDPALAAAARANLEKAGVANVTVETGCGFAGAIQTGPYDVIMVSGAVPVVPAELLDQLKVNGRLFAFVGEDPVITATLITRVDATTLRTETFFEAVVPALKGVAAKSRFIF
jgi:protein-L-isoaspartate(D-aspartate) O-methyltransferase